MPKKKIPEFPDLMEEQGAFGRIQFVFFFIICAGINSVGWEQYNYYLTTAPTWYCSFTNKEGKNMTYTIDSIQELKQDDTEAKEYCKPDYFCSRLDGDKGKKDNTENM